MYLHVSGFSCVGITLFLFASGILLIFLTGECTYVLYYTRSELALLAHSCFITPFSPDDLFLFCGYRSSGGKVDRPLMRVHILADHVTLSIS